MGSIAVDLQEAGKAYQMVLYAFTAAAFLKAISDHRWLMPPNGRSSRA